MAMGDFTTSSPHKPIFAHTSKITFNIFHEKKDIKQGGFGITRPTSISIEIPNKKDERPGHPVFAKNWSRTHLFAPFAELIMPFPSDFAYKSLIKCYPNPFLHLFQMNDLFFHRIMERHRKHNVRTGSCGSPDLQFTNICLVDPTQFIYICSAVKI